MRSNTSQPIHVLNVFRGIPGNEIPYPITPYRFALQNGKSYHIAEIRHLHRERKGKGIHFHYVVSTRENRIFQLLFDTNAFTWRLVEEAK